MLLSDRNFRRGLCASALASCVLVNCEARARDFTVRTDVWVWSGAGDWFVPQNWNHGFGGLLGAPTAANFNVYMGPEAYSVQGVFVGYLFPLGEAVLTSNYSSPEFKMGAGYPTTATITDGAVYSTWARIGVTSNDGFLGPNPSPGPPSTVNLIGSTINGNVYVGESAGGVGVLNILGNSTVTGSVFLAVEEGSVGVLNIGANSTASFGYVSVGAGRATINLASDFSPQYLYAYQSDLGLSVSEGVTLTLTNAGIGGFITSSGSISLGTISSPGSLFVDRTLALDGGGEIVMPHVNSILTGQAGDLIYDRLINTDHVIRGRGLINVDVTNQHIIRAEGGVLQLLVSEAFDNTQGLIEVAADGTLSVYGGTFDNTGIGDLSIQPGGRVAHGSTLNSVNLVGAGPLVIENGTIEFVRQVNNSGTITIDNGSFKVEGPVTLQGGGEVVLTSGGASTIFYGSGNLPGDRLINTDHVIRGSGSISVDVTNQHIIRAEGGLLQLAVSEAFDNTQGLIEVAADGVLSVYGGTFDDTVIGDLSIQPGGRVAHGSTLNSVNLLGPGPLVIENGTIEFVRQVNNSGTITIDNGSFKVEGPVTLQGGGEVVLTSGGASTIFYGSGNLPGDRLINTDHVIRGSGSISVDVTNQHIVRAEGGLLQLAVSEAFDNTQGLIEVAADGSLIISGGTFDDTVIGDLSIQPGGRVAHGSTLNSVDLLGPGPLVIENGTIEFVRQVNNSGTITIDNGSFEVEGPVSLQGGGEVVLTSDSASTIFYGSDNLPGDLLINTDHVIRGRGLINVDVTNQHIIRAEGGVLTLGTSVTGAGTVEVAPDATLSVLASPLQTPLLSIAPTGSLIFNNSRIEVARVVGSLQQSSGTLAPAPGIVSASVSGDYIMSSANGNAMLEIDLADSSTGSFDRLTIEGDCVIAGALSVVSVPGFAAQPGDRFRIVTVHGSRSGSFAGLPEGAFVDRFGKDLYITYTAGDGNDVELFAVPCFGDANRDSGVSFVDISVVLANFGVQYATTGLGDANSDSLVNFGDVSSVLANFGSVCE